MSNAYYGELWLVTEKDMEKLLQLDDMAQSSKSPKPKDVALETILPLYLKYRDLVRRLIMCHDQIIQPQKRELIKKILDCAIGRMLEYNKEIVGLESNDYQWPDDFMIKNKFTPDDVTIPVSMSYVADRQEFLRHRREYIDNLIDNETKSSSPNVQEQHARHEEEAKLSNTTTESDARPSLIRPKRRVKTVETVKTQVHAESVEDKAAREAREAAEKAFVKSILTIQSHERARTGRCIGARVERDYNYKKRLALGELEPKKMTNKVKEKAATTIQRHWRGFAVREFLKRRMNRMDELIDMTVPSWTNESTIKEDKNNRRRRSTLQPLAVTSLEETTTNLRAGIFRIKGPGVMEDITDEIREWFVLWYNELGHFDAYPVAEVGGSILVVTGQTFTPDEYLVDKWEKATEKSNNNKKNKQSPRSNEKQNKANKKSEDAGWTMPDDSKALRGLFLAKNEFINDWSLTTESDDHRETGRYLDLVNAKLWYELQLEMREIVDELMRLELAKLNEALIKDHAGDKQKFVIPGMEKGKKGKKKSKKKKGKKDLSSSMPTEKMFEELVLAKIIRNYSEKHLDDWHGDLSYQNYEARLNLRDYGHRLGEIKQSIMNYCILPLGSKEVHAIAPLIRSVCICGLPGYGKTFLADAICTAVGALLFDLTPKVLAGLYEGKKNEEKLMSMIGKLAREHAPSIVLIDGGEKPWMKKIPPADRYAQPKRLAKLLPKFVKTIKPGDRVLLLSVATEPYKAGRPFMKIHDKILMIPVTDYNTIYMFYRKILIKYHGVDRDFNVSGLARLSIGYPLESIDRVVAKVMNLNRRITLRFKPLDPQEILDELLTREIPNPKTVDQFLKFENRTPLGKTRTKMINALKEARDDAQQVEKKSRAKK